MDVYFESRVTLCLIPEEKLVAATTNATKNTICICEQHKCKLLCFVPGDSSGVSDPHYQVFVELDGVRNISEEQRYKVQNHMEDCLGGSLQNSRGIR